MEQIRRIFDHWNSKSGTWRTHRKLNPIISNAIQDRLKDIGEEEILGAIDNYHRILNDKKYCWSYVWALHEFLTRRRDKSRRDCDLQILRFAPNSIIEEQFPRVDMPFEADIDDGDARELLGYE